MSKAIKILLLRRSEIPCCKNRVCLIDHCSLDESEAPIVIYSVTTSSYLDAPRGMEFLYSANRLNVATSRARAICVLVASPAIFEVEIRTPGQIKLANAFCRYLERAIKI